MSDPSVALSDALDPFLRGHAAVVAAFGAQRVKIYDAPPDNAAGSYLVIGAVQVLPDVAERLDGAEINLTLDIWSDMNPPGRALAKRIGAGVLAALLPVNEDGVASLPALDLAGHRLVAAQLVSASYLMDPNGRTAHGVLILRLNTEPL